MKKIFLVAWVAMGAILGGCNRDSVDNPNLGGADFTLTSQADVNAFSGSGDIRTLTIKGAEIADLSKLNVQKVKNLVVENTGVVSLNIPKLEAVSVSFVIKGNAKLQNLNGISNLKFFGGELKIDDNDALTDISGIMGIKTFFGTLTVIGNKLLGENIYPMPSEKFGFYPIKTMINNGIIPSATAVTLANNHPDAVSDASLIGVPQGDPILDYIIRSKSDALNFKCWNSQGIVNNITISGSDIDDEAIYKLSDKISKVMGTFSLSNAPVGNFDMIVFERIKIAGSFIIKNLPNIDNINSFKALAGEIKGDLIIEDMPNIDFGWDEPWPAGSGFQKITKIGGSLVIRNCKKFESGGFKNLTYIGGDAIFENIIGGIGHFGPMDKLTYIGGNISIQNIPSLVSLYGFHNLQHIGGSKITITGTPKIPTKANGPDLWNLPGFCLIRDAFNYGVIKNPNCVITLSNTAPVDFATLTGCQ